MRTVISMINSTHLEHSAPRWMFVGLILWPLLDLLYLARLYLCNALGPGCLLGGFTVYCMSEQELHALGTEVRELRFAVEILARRVSVLEVSDFDLASEPEQGPLLASAPAPSGASSAASPSLLLQSPPAALPAPCG